MNSLWWNLGFGAMLGAGFWLIGTFGAEWLRRRRDVGMVVRIRKSEDLPGIPESATALLVAAIRSGKTMRINVADINGEDYSGLVIAASDRRMIRLLENAMTEYEAELAARAGEA